MLLPERVGQRKLGKGDRVVHMTFVWPLLPPERVGQRKLGKGDRVVHMTCTT